MSRFFHSLVVFGAGVSLSGCGGKTTDTSQHTDEGTGGSSSVGSGGGSATGGVQAILGGGTGGSTGVIATPLPTADPYVDAGPILDVGTLAQWDCTQQTGNCVDSIELEILRRACPVDKTRPRAQSDCGAAQWFECDQALLDGKQVAVSCRCMPGGDGGVPCGACTPLNPGLSQRSISCVNHSKICGCAITLIR